MLNMPAIILLISGGLILTIGDIVFKFYAVAPKSYLYVIGLVIYVIGLMFLVQTFKTENIAVASAVFVIANIVTLLIVSWLYFGEPLSGIKIIGIIIAIIAILVLELGK